LILVQYERDAQIAEILLAKFYLYFFPTGLERKDQRLNEATAFSFGTVSKSVIVNYIEVSAECVRKQRAHLIY
jgi:hypothetical protein